MEQHEADMDADFARITRYVAGEGTAQERAVAGAWIVANPSLQPLADELRALMAAVPSADRDVDKAWTDARRRIADAATVPERRSSRRRVVSPAVRQGRVRWIGATAVVLLLLIGTSAMFGAFKAPAGRMALGGAVSTYHTQPGQRATLTLDDGSRVVLGPASTMRVVRHTDGGAMAPVTVDVTGDALFAVAHSARRPFLVTAHGVTTRVLGTEFAVHAFDASLVRVAVREGRVSVQAPIVTPANAVVVAAGQAVAVTPTDAPMVAAIGDTDADFSWASGTLVLRNVPLGEAFARLSRWYGMEFRVADTTLFKMQVNGTFPSAFNAADVQSLANVVGARMVRSGSTLTFFDKGSP